MAGAVQSAPMLVCVMKKPHRPERFETIGEWIRFNRENARYSLRGLGEEFGKSHMWVSKIESNDTKVSRETVERIAELTGADTDEGVRLLSMTQIAGRDALDYLPESEQALIRAYRDDADFRRMADRLIGQPAQSPPPAREAVDTRSAAERAQGVPVMAQTKLPPKTRREPDF